MEKEGLDLHEQYAEKTKEMKEKYADVINEIAVARGVDVGIGFEMLKAVCRGGDYLDGVEIEINLDELKQDYMELCAISEEIAKMNGLV